MPVPKAARELQEALEEHAHRIGSGPYAELCKKLLGLTNALEDEAVATKREFAIHVLMEHAQSAAAPSMERFTNKREFMQELVRRKALELQEHDDKHRAAMLGLAWKLDLTEALMPYQDPTYLKDVRFGVQKLFVARSGFLPQVVNRLTHLSITPAMLCPLDLGADLEQGDDGRGPVAEDFLYYEPRFLRWILGMGELEPWPTLGIGAQPEYMSRLIIVANSEGGDNRAVNQACACPRCRGVRIPTLDAARASLTPSECSSDSENEMVL